VLGKRIYRQGLLPSGQPVRATVQYDAPFTGRQLSCVSCHRRSGLGSSEGPVGIPAISGAYLFQPREVRRTSVYQTSVKGPGTRPAFTNDTLKRAIRDGLDPSGRVLDPVMPRYNLDDEALEHLVAYLKTLSVEPSPGVTNTTIHFATIVTEDADSEKRKALLDVLQTYFADKNAEIRGELRRQETTKVQSAVLGISRKYKAYRKWQLHVWDLRGPNETWSRQLERYYKEQPVFAVISGLGRGRWQPVHEFCERSELPCLLPITDLPGVSDTDFYSIYFSKGLTLEAQALAKYLNSDSATNNHMGKVVQVFRDRDGAVPADALRQALQTKGFSPTTDRNISRMQKLTTSFWRNLVEKDKPDVLVLWLADDDLRDLNALAQPGAKRMRIFLSSTLVSDSKRIVPKTLRESAYLAHPFDLPDASARKFIRTRNWLRFKGLQVADMRVQASAYLAATIANRAVTHLRDNFSREFFIERIEHMMDNIISTFIYPHLSLGPDQRFASKGCYIAKLSEDDRTRLEVVSEWIVP